MKQLAYWLAVGVLVVAIGFAIRLTLDTDAPRRAEDRVESPTPVPTRVVKVQVPTSGSLAEWEAELVRQEKSLRDREAEVEEWIEHLKGREKAILAEETCLR